MVDSQRREVVDLRHISQVAFRHMMNACVYVYACVCVCVAKVHNQLQDKTPRPRHTSLAGIPSS